MLQRTRDTGSSLCINQSSKTLVAWAGIPVGHLIRLCLVEIYAYPILVVFPEQHDSKTLFRLIRGEHRPMQLGFCVHSNNIDLAMTLHMH